MKQLGRFLRLERARKDSEPEVPLPPRRFATLEEAPVPGTVVRHSAAALERFAPEPAPALELEAPDGDEPFVRCLRCGADSVRHAVVCRQCEAGLDSEEVRAFNLRLWAEMTAAREREAEDARRHEALRRGGAATHVEDERNALAAEFAAREQARRALEMRSGWASARAWGQFSDDGVGLRHILVGVAVGIPVLLAFSRRGTVGISATLLAGLVVAVLLVFRRLR
jgi:hypothetical protein